MARGPFEGTWQQGIRPTVVTAPDALVYINGETDIIGCASCRRRFDFNRYITSIQTNLSVDSSPGTATINISIPRHSVDEFMFDGEPLISPMMEIEIFAKGYFLVEGLPQYYPIFWGLVTEVNDSFSSGETSFTIQCADILKWWELCKMNVHPAFTQASGQLGTSIFGNVLFGSNPYDMIWTLAQQAFGDVVVGSGSLVSLYKEGTQKQTFNAALGDIMLYWQQRFSKIRSNLLLYGTRGNAVRGDLLYQTYQKQGGGKNFKDSKAVPTASQAVRQANGGEDGSQMVFDPTSSEVTAYRTQFSQAGQVNFWQSEFQTKLEIANTCKEAIGFEFFMDVTGDIVFKPPFYNLDVLANKPVSWIQSIDIIDRDLGLSEAEVFTQIQLQGSFGGNVDYGFGEEATPNTSVTDYHLLRKYGWRTTTYNSEFSGNPQQMFYIGMDMLDRYNARRHRGTINIPCRPELRLGFPVYVAPKDQFWYLTGISHNIQFGGRATTALTLTGRRGKFLAPRGIGTIELVGYKGAKDAQANPATPLKDLNLTSRQLAAGGTFRAKVGDAAQLPPINVPETAAGNNPYEPLVLRHPKTGRMCGFPNAVMAYTRPFVDPTPHELAKVAGQKDASTKRVPPSVVQDVNKQGKDLIDPFLREQHTVTEDDKLREKYRNNRYSFGLTSAGVYTYLRDTSQVIKDILIMPAKNVTFDESSNNLKLEGSSGMIRPVSDERGFEVIGHFRYGRGVSLRDGSLILNVSSENPNALNSRAEVSTQLAVSGSLFETLTQQSQGLTVQSAFTSNPALAIATLGAEDLQTAGVINPETGQPEFLNNGTNFVQTAPLGSPEQVGLTNSTSLTDVEASQLSRALTLAELTVKEDVVAQDECECVLGRADLAFIATGYQIKVVGTSADANATIGFGALSGDFSSEESKAKLNALFLAEHAAADAAEKEAQELNDADPLARINEAAFQQDAGNRILDARLAAQKKFREEHAAEYAEYGGDEQLGILAEAMRDGKPVADTVLSASQTMLRVESFMTGLYQVLDTAHQEYEKALRGELVITPQSSAENVRFGVPPDQSNLSPPFSTPARAIGGDPLALARMAEDSFNEATEAWGSLSEQLNAQAKRADLIAQIQAKKIEASALQAEVDAAAQFGLTAPEAQASLNQLLQEIAELQQQLDTLNQKF